MADEKGQINSGATVHSLAGRRRLRGGGDGGTVDGMLEARVARLEEDMKEVRSDLKAIRIDLAEVKGRLSSMPTTIQLIGFVIAIFVAAGVLKYFGH